MNRPYLGRFEDLPRGFQPLNLEKEVISLSWLDIQGISFGEGVGILHLQNRINQYLEEGGLSQSYP